DLDPEFTITTAGISLDATQAPILISSNGTTYVFRYFTTGAVHDADVQLSFIGGSLYFVNAAGVRIPFLAPRELDVPNGGTSTAPDFVVDVPFGDPAAYTGSTITKTSITIAGVTVNSVEPGPSTTTQAGTYRFHITSATSTPLTSTQKVVVKYVNGS